MDTRQSIIEFIERHGSSGSRELCSDLGISRQALNVHLNQLIDAGRIVRTGATRNTRYQLEKRVVRPEPYRAALPMKNLDEARAYERLASSLNLGRVLDPPAKTLFEYVFTEMLNNAVDHSESVRVKVSAALEPGFVTAEIKDYGIGVFASIAEKLRYADEHEALLHLVKGKTTTMPGKHSGEGIFFSSKAADRLLLRSHRIQVEWDEGKKDVFVSNQRFVKGTDVRFQVRRHSRKKLEEVFNTYAPREFDYRFSRTKVQVKLLGKTYISRSEARRLLVNLDRFQQVELDFAGVESIGQGFADEVFRVFPNQRPGIVMEPVNARPAVAAMIRHVEAEAAS